MACDFNIYAENGGRSSVFLLTPLTQEAVSWIEENVQYESWQRMGTGIAVDHRMIGCLVAVIQAAGFRVEGT